MMTSGRNLIVLSDGTGNSASKSFKTNVWRLYQASTSTMEARSPCSATASARRASRSCACSGSRSGSASSATCSICTNFSAATTSQDDRIWVFGFSRGAFTIRVLVGLIHPEGLVSFAPKRS